MHKSIMTNDSIQNNTQHSAHFPTGLRSRELDRLKERERGGESGDGVRGARPRGRARLRLGLREGEKERGINRRFSVSARPLEGP